MGEKNKKNSEEQQKEEGAETKKKGNGGKNNSITVVLKADLHCEGCVSKVLKCIRSIDGVETASIAGEQKITVVGKMDPAKLREKVEQKTHKRVEVISPQPKKDDSNKEKARGKENSGSDNVKQEKKKEDKDKNPKNKSEEKKTKEKEPTVATAVLKVHLHCEGCTQKIRKIISKTKGYKDMKIDKQKELVTVTGAMDMKALAEVLKKHLKRDVQIQPPPKKEAEKKENAGGEKVKGGGDKGKGGGDKGKNGGDGGGKAAGAEKAEGNRVHFQLGNPCPSVYGPGMPADQFHYNPNPSGYGPGMPVDQCHYNPNQSGYGPYHAVHAPQLFSDENPNACSVM